MKLVFFGHKMSKYPQLLTRILKIYIESSAGFSLVHHPDLNNTLLSQGCVLEAASSLGEAGRMHMPRTRGGKESHCPGPTQGSAWSHILSMTSSNIINTGGDFL